MANFSYKAATKAGKTVQGTLEADSKRHAVAALRARGLTPLEISASSSEAAPREKGRLLAALREKLENNWSEAKLRLWGRLMAETRMLEDGRLAAAFVTRTVLAETGSRREDAEGFVEQLRRLSSVRVALLLREDEKDGKVVTKASLRSSGGDSVRDVAAQFGGGGHKNAAGATLGMEAEQALEALLPHIRAIWN
jgi:phosphoesterase RecJ-like protein